MVAIKTLKHKHHLFGGALFGAGIVTIAAVTTTATADFIAAATPSGYLPSYSQVVGNGTAVDSVNLFDFTYAAAFPTSYSYSGNGLEASAYAGTNLMGASLNLTDAATWNYAARVTTVQWFTVAYDKEVTLEWDFTNIFIGYGEVFQYGVGIVYTPPLGTAGTISLNLVPGELYRFNAVLVQQNGTNGGGFVRISNIPAPGSLALLGIGFVTARHRRRRE